MSHTHYDFNYCQDDMCFDYKKSLEVVEFNPNSILNFFMYFLMINITCLTATFFIKYVINYVNNYRLIRKYIKYKDEKKLLIRQINNLLLDNQNKKNNIIRCTFERYVELIELRQFLGNDNNLEKVINFYKNPENYIKKAIEIINDEYRYVFLNKETFLNYYKGYFTEEQLTLVNNDELAYINLNNLYLEEQMIIDKEFFNIENKNNYYPLEPNLLTNLPQLNVVRWLIEIGFYDFITDL